MRAEALSDPTFLNLLADSMANVRQYAFIVIGVLAVPCVLWGQNPGRRGPAQPQRQRAKAENGKEDKETRPLPSDPKLLSFHKEFVNKVEKLASDYERSNQGEKARACYEEILKLVPEYGPAIEKLGRLRAKELTAERKTMDIHANREWQDTGVIVVPGKPVRIAAKGSWTFNLSHELSPKGMQIPKELRDFDLGALVGVIVPSQKRDDVKPFLIGDGIELTGEEAGRLMLRMYDTDPSDNTGKISVEITGTYARD